MINFEKFILDNGLKVLVHEDNSTPLIALNIMYNVGARDENPNKTGFAHLFEHLMFEGSANVPEYDVPLQKVGGTNNAFTNNDITNYYLTVPAENIETACWIESDRMLELKLTQEKLDIQKKVVIEEFKQRYLNQPYGDAMLKLRALAYKKHPYQWSTIGKEIVHIENASLDDVSEFYQRFYNPNNAILCFAGNINLAKAKELCQKWFADIPKGENYIRTLPSEPKQEKYQSQLIEADVPLRKIYRAYHMCNRNSKDYYATDLISDILSNGDSSRFEQELVKGKKIFTNIEAYISGSFDNGLFLIEADIKNGVGTNTAKEKIDSCLNKMRDEIADRELQKLKNKVETSFVSSNITAQQIAMNLCYYEILGKAELINEEVGKYQAVKCVDIKRLTEDIFKQTNCSEIIYLPKN